jgi:hypothetical protein
MANEASLPVLLKELKLNSIARHRETLAQKALDEQWLPHIVQISAESYWLKDKRKIGTSPTKP